MVLFAAATAAEIAPAAPKPRQRTPYARGAALARAGKLPEALAELEKAAKLEPRNPKVHNLSGVVLSQLGRLNEANEAYNRALALAPDFYPARKNRASNAFLLREFQFAAAEFAVLARLRPKDHVPRLFLGLLAIEDKDFQRARKHLLQARRLAPTDSRVLLAVVRVHFVLGERQAALEAARELRAKPCASSAERFDLGVLLGSFGANAVAAQVFQGLWQEKPGAYDIGFNLALFQYRAGQTEAAFRTVEELLYRGHGLAELWNLRGWICHHLRRQEQAIASLQRAIAMEPAASEHYLDLSTVLLDVGDLDSAGRVIAEGIEKSTEKDGLFVQMGLLHRRQNDLRQAEDRFRKALETNPANEAAYLALAHLLLVMEREREGFALMETALERLHSSALLHYVYGALLMETATPEDMDRQEKARLVLEKALALNPLFANTHYRLARIYLVRGEEDKALRNLEAASSLNPKHTKALYQLSQILARRGDRRRAAELSRALRQLLAEKYRSSHEDFSAVVRESLRRSEGAGSFGGPEQ